VPRRSPNGTQRYDLDVFINCPFDARYRPIFNAIIFAVHDCGQIARSALEVYDSGLVRIGKITDLIAECGLGLHDLSRTELDPVTALPRFNMPLELGVFPGAQWLGTPKRKRKSCLVLDREKYRYQKFCSDIAGKDIAAHEDDPERAVKAARNWLRSVRSDVSIPGGAKIWQRFLQFRNDLPILCEPLYLEPEELTFNDDTGLVALWQKQNEW
jgi:hypothetical protein